MKEIIDAVNLSSTGLWLYFRTKIHNIFWASKGRSDAFVTAS